MLRMQKIPRLNGSCLRNTFELTKLHCLGDGKKHFAPGISWVGRDLPPKGVTKF